MLYIEEKALQASRFSDLSIKEMHTIEAIGMYERHTSTEVANKLNITVGTLTVAVNALVRKGYVTRIRSEADRRVIQLALTPKGRLLYRLHDKFHRDMVVETLRDMDEQEASALIHALANLHHFLLSRQQSILEQ